MKTTKSNITVSNQTKSNITVSNQTESNQTKSNQTSNKTEKNKTEKNETSNKNEKNETSNIVNEIKKPIIIEYGDKKYGNKYKKKSNRIHMEKVYRRLNSNTKIKLGNKLEVKSDYSKLSEEEIDKTFKELNEKIYNQTVNFNKLEERERIIKTEIYNDEWKCLKLGELKFNMVNKDIEWKFKLFKGYVLLSKIKINSTGDDILLKEWKIIEYKGINIDVISNYEKVTKINGIVKSKKTTSYLNNRNYKNKYGTNTRNNNEYKYSRNGTYIDLKSKVGDWNRNNSKESVMLKLHGKDIRLLRKYNGQFMMEVKSIDGN